MHSKETLELRKKLNSKKIYFKDIMPSKYQVKAELSVYESTDIDLSEFKGKLYDDPVFGQELPKACSIFSVLYGDWLLEEEDDEKAGIYMIKLIDNKSGQYIKIGFADKTNKLKFLNEMNVSRPIKQQNSGMNIEDVVNKNLIYVKKKKNFFNLSITGTLLIIGAMRMLKYKKK